MFLTVFIGACILVLAAKEGLALIMNKRYHEENMAAKERLYDLICRFYLVLNQEKTPRSHKEQIDYLKAQKELIEAQILYEEKVNGK